jgi:hypothetical protein
MKNFTKSNKFGTWQVSGLHYKNKLSAVIDAVKIGHWIHWDFNESIFTKYDWTKEPSRSLTDLYGDRAKKLREKYAHIAVEFSGGADSWNLLYHFCRLNLPVDTVIHRYTDTAVKEKHNLTSENVWAEGKFQAWPSFQKLKELNPNLKWHTWDIVESTQDFWSSTNIDFTVHNNLQPGAAQKTPGGANINPFGIPDLPSTAMVYGIDKPMIEFDNGNFYLVFYDTQIIFRSVIERELAGISMEDILFYWDPENIDMLAKQGHTVMNWFRQNPHMIPLISHRPSYLSIINKLVYPEYSPIWQSEKPTGGMFTLSHEKWFTHNQSMRGCNEWHKMRRNQTDFLDSIVAGTEFTKHINPDEFGDARYKALSACPSKRYYLGSLTN